MVLANVQKSAPIGCVFKKYIYKPSPTENRAQPNPKVSPWRYGATNFVLNAVHWGFQHQERGDVFHDLPPNMKTSFHTLCNYAHDSKVWSDYCNDVNQTKWVRYDNNGEAQVSTCGE